MKKGAKITIKILVVFAILVLLVFLCMPLLLNTGFVKSRITKNLNQRSGLSWSIGSIGLVGYRELHFEGLVAEQPTELVKAKRGKEEGLPELIKISSLRVIPRWRALFKKELELERVEVIKPEANVSVEMLLAIASQMRTQEGSNIIVEPRLENTRVAESVVSPENHPKQQPKPTKPKEEFRQGAKPTAVSEEGPEISAPKANSPVSKKVERPPSYLVVKDASLKLFRAKDGLNIFRASGVSMKVPFTGDSSDGNASWKEISLLEEKISPEGGMPVAFRNRRWLAGGEFDLLGVKLMTKIEVLKRRDFPFLMRLYAPKQSIENLQTGTNHVKIGMERFEVEVQLGGQGVKPVSWRGLANVRGRGMRVTEDLRGFTRFFDRFGLSAQLSGGSLYAPTGFIVGEQLSVFANGQVRSNGEVAAIMRIIGDEEVREWTTVFTRGAVLARGRESHFWLSPMPECPVRYIRDLHLQGEIGDLWIDTGPKKSWVSFPLFIRLLKSFKDREFRE